MAETNKNDATNLAEIARAATTGDAQLISIAINKAVEAGVQAPKLAATLRLIAAGAGFPMAWRTANAMKNSLLAAGIQRITWPMIDAPDDVRNGQRLLTEVVGGAGARGLEVDHRSLAESLLNLNAAAPYTAVYPYEVVPGKPIETAQMQRVVTIACLIGGSKVIDNPQHPQRSELNLLPSPRLSMEHELLLHVNGALRPDRPTLPPSSVTSILEACSSIGERTKAQIADASIAGMIKSWPPHESPKVDLVISSDTQLSLAKLGAAVGVGDPVIIENALREIVRTQSLSPEHVGWAIAHTAPYCGIPKAMAAIVIANRVFFPRTPERTVGTSGNSDQLAQNVALRVFAGNQSGEIGAAIERLSPMFTEYLAKMESTFGERMPLTTPERYAITAPMTATTYRGAVNTAGRTLAA